MLFRSGMVRYSRVWDVLLAFLGCALALLACQKLRTPLRELAAHALRHVLEVALLTGAIGLLWWIIDTIVSWITPKPEWVAGNTTSGMVLFVGIQGLVGGAELRRRGDARTTASRACAIALIWSAASFASLEWLEGASFACTWPLIFAAIGILAAMTKQASRTADAIMVIGLAGALLLGLPLLQLLVQLFERVPLLAILLAGTTLASGAGLFAPAFERMRRDVPWTPRVLLGAGVLGLVASVVVARVLVWRQGALFP